MNKKRETISANNARMRELEGLIAAETDAAKRQAYREEWEAKHRENQRLICEIQVEGQESGQRERVSIISLLREAREGKRDKTINMRSVLSASGLAGKAIETEFQDILAPLYAKSVLSQLGVRMINSGGGNLSVPVMNPSNVQWLGETAANQDGTPTFGTNIELKPKRLTGYMDISEQMLLQDTLGVEQAVMADAVNALKCKLEATIFGNAAGSATQPAGMFYGKTLADATSFEKLVQLEAGVEDANVYGEMRYLLSTKAKAAFRCMAKGAKSTQLVMEGGMVDGTPALTTSNVKNGTKAPFVYGDFSNLAVGIWNDLIIKLDDSVAYSNGAYRLYVTGYFDAAVLRAGAFAYGDAAFAG